jgi:hypothetical protein
MNLQEWLKWELEYSQDIVHSAVEGARCGCRRASADEPPRKVFARAACNSLPLAAVGACVVPLAAQWAGKRNSLRNEVVFGFVGALIGFSAAFALRTRPLVEEMAQEAVHNINDMRDAHWLAQHPIDYA